MDNFDEVRAAIDEFNNQPSENWPEILLVYLRRVAQTGETLFPWSVVRNLVLSKVDSVMKQSQNDNSMDEIPACPNKENIKFQAQHSRIMKALEKFDGAPFTIQRLMEIVLDPQQNYPRTDKLLHGIEKNVLVVSTVDPYGNKIISETFKMNGVNGFESTAAAGELVSETVPPPVSCETIFPVSMSAIDPEITTVWPSPDMNGMTPEVRNAGPGPSAESSESDTSVSSLSDSDASSAGLSDSPTGSGSPVDESGGVFLSKIHDPGAVDSSSSSKAAAAEEPEEQTEAATQAATTSEGEGLCADQTAADTATTAAVHVEQSKADQETSETQTSDAASGDSQTSSGKRQAHDSPDEQPSSKRQRSNEGLPVSVCSQDAEETSDSRSPEKVTDEKLSTEGSVNIPSVEISAEESNKNISDSPVTVAEMQTVQQETMCSESELLTTQKTAEITQTTVETTQTTTETAQTTVETTQTTAETTQTAKENLQEKHDGRGDEVVRKDSDEMQETIDKKETLASAADEQTKSETNTS